MSRVKAELGLRRETLVGLAIFLGCDYIPKVIHQKSYITNDTRPLQLSLSTVVFLFRVLQVLEKNKRWNWYTIWKDKLSFRSMDRLNEANVYDVLCEW